MSNHPPSAHGLRAWQVEALQKLGAWRHGAFLISAAPGAGKTRPSLEFARREFIARRLDGVVVVCPTAPLTRQWARAAHELGLHLLPDAEGPRPPRGFHGVVVTYARVSRDPAAWAAVTRDTLVIADEAHHLGEELTWGQGFAEAFRPAARWLLLSGTPFRSDKTSIPGVSYSEAGVAESDVKYGYADAVADGVCRPMVFVPFDGQLAWRSGGVEQEASFADDLSKREHSRRYRTAISTALDDGLPRILGEAHQRLSVLRAEHRDAGALAVTADSEHAMAVAGILERLMGRRPVVVLHTDPNAHTRLHAFKESDEPWIVAVNMVSEGVDIPRLRVGVYATTAKTAMIFRQIVGRFVRTIPGRPVEPSWLYLPAEPILRDHAARIEQEVATARKKRGESQKGDDGEWDDLEDALAYGEEEPEALAYEPLAANVSTEQEYATRVAPPPDAVAPGQPAPTEAPAVFAPWPTFERRSWLLDERNRLAGAVAQAQNRGKRTVLTWANREVGADTDEPTLEQLEASVELLARRLAPVAMSLRA